MLKKILFIGIGIIMFVQADEWKNWAGNQQCNVKIVKPKSIQELIEIVQKANKENVKIRAYGTGHSWSNIVCADGYVINTDKLNKIISVDKKKNQVTVQSGIKLEDLNVQLAKLGLCLSNQGAITKQSLAGVVSTATHGSGKTGTFASFITKVQLLTADGILKTFSETENSDLFAAVRTSIGSLGIMTELTVQCEPLFKVRQEHRISRWQTIWKEYEALLENNDYMQFYWNVSDDSVYITIHNRISNADKNAKTRDSSANSISQNEGYSYQMLSGALEQVYMEEEIAIPIERVVEAAQAARKLVQQEYNKSSMFDGILFRFVSAEQQNLLSPAVERNVVFFSITTSSTSGYEQFYKKFYNLMLPFGGRPHWGKINYLTKKDAQKLYGKNFQEFIKIRKQLDPQGLFSNAFTERVFGW